jgi:hypothetical protein
LSIGYVSGWVDDANEALGQLHQKGVKIKNRKAGSIYPSMDIKYLSKSLKKWYDCETQFKLLNNQNVFELELHGHTHLSPNIEGWLSSDDKYQEVNWYREFLNTQTFPFSQQSQELQKSIIYNSLTIFSQKNIKKPWVLIPPGNKISYNTMKTALDLGIPMMNDTSVVIDKNGYPYRCNLIKTLDGSKDEELKGLDSSYATTMMIHDKDIHDYGVDWFEKIVTIMNKQNKKIHTLKDLYFKLALNPTIIHDKTQNTLSLNYHLSDRLFEILKQKEMNLDYLLKLPANTSILSLPKGVKKISSGHYKITINSKDFKKVIQLKSIDNR